jgi:formylglycine-generating enzyme required for sulfatase activity
MVAMATLATVFLGWVTPTWGDSTKALQLFSQGFELLKAGKPAEAATKFEAGLMADPKNALGHFYLGEAYFEQKLPDKAKLHYQKSLKLDSASSVAALAKQRLDELASGGGTMAPAAPTVGSNSKSPGSVFKDCETCPEMVVVPAGKFIMGSPPSEEGRFESEGPPHIVALASEFAMGRTEVTRGQFAAFISDTGYQSGDECFTFENGSWDKRSGRNWRNPGFAQDDAHPVVCVSWNDAKAYVEWLTAKTGHKYHLPSESEWEYAARGGTSTARYWGDSSGLACAYANVFDITGKAQGIPGEAHSCDDKYAYTAPVASFKANAFGLHDVIGNAWEWVEDCFHDNYNDAPADGSVWMSGECKYRVLRGASWLNDPRFARSAIRDRVTPEFRGSGSGFRLARMLP